MGIKKLLRRIKSGWDNIWSPIGGNSRRSGSYDVWREEREPSQVELINAVNESVYACASLIANNLSDIELKLCVQTGVKDKQTRLQTRPLGKKYLRGRRKAVAVEEVLDHKILDLLDNPNPDMSWKALLGLTQLYLDVTGNSYWKIQFDRAGFPAFLWLLLSQNVTPIRDRSGNITAYKNGTGEGAETLQPHEVIHFKNHDLLDPYGNGISPLRAVWQRVQLGRKELSSWESILNNIAAPSFTLTPPPGEIISPDNAERYAKEYEERFRYGQGGSVFVNSDGMILAPVISPPKDMASLQLYEQIKKSVCNVYFVPVTLLDMNESNYASAETGEAAFQKRCLKPRIGNIVEVLNKRIVSLYDDRLFLESEEIITPDKEFELRKRDTMIKDFVYTINQWREEEGWEPVAWGNEPYIPGAQTFAGGFAGQAPGAAGATPGEQPDNAIDAAAQDADNSGDSDNALRATVGGSQQIAALQEAVYSGRMPRLAAIANCVTVFGFSQSEAESLFPDVAGYEPPQEGGHPPELEPAPAPRALSLDRKNAEAEAGNASPRLLALALQDVFRRQEAEILAKFGAGKSLKAMPSGEWFDLSSWDSELSAALQPILQAYYDFGSKQVIERIGKLTSVPKVLPEKLSEAVGKATLQFCQATNETTSQDLATAISNLRSSLREGLSEGEVMQKLSDRVKEVFENASTNRAHKIAITEQSRATNEAELITAKESGVNMKKKWLASANACPECLAMNGRTVDLDTPFAVKGTGAYDTIQAPPYHPNCFCALTYSIEGIDY